MNHEFEKLTPHAKGTSLTEMEKNALRTRLVAFMEEHPVREGNVLRLLKRLAAFFSLFRITIPKSMIAVMVALLIVVGGGTSYAAEGSVPGDVLYPVKVHINEQVRTAVTTSTKGKAEWETKRVERRLEEATELSAKGKLEGDVQTKVGEQFDAQVERVQKRVSALEAEGKVEQAEALNAQMGTALKAHENVLIRLEGKKERPKKDAPLIQKVDARIRAQESVRVKREKDKEKNEDKQKTDERLNVAAHTHLRLAEDAISETKMFIEKHQASLSAETLVRIETRVQQANELLINGKTELEAQRYKAAVELFQDVSTAARETRVAVNLLLKTRIEVFENVQPAVEEKDDEDEDEDEDDGDTTRGVDIIKIKTENKIQGSGRVRIGP